MNMLNSNMNMLNSNMNMKVKNNLLITSFLSPSGKNSQSLEFGDKINNQSTNN
jgi:hypothetical protein